MASEVGSYTNKIHYIKKKILEELTKKQYAQVFMRPMDKRHGDYQNVIRKPMDLGTIITWVQNRFYRNADELIADLRLVYRNWFALKKGSPILCRPANQLQKFVENKLVQMPDGEEFEIKKDSRMTARSIKDFPWLQLNGTQEMEPLSTFIPIKTEPDSVRAEPDSVREEPATEWVYEISELPEDHMPDRTETVMDPVWVSAVSEPVDVPMTTETMDPVCLSVIPEPIDDPVLMIPDPTPMITEIKDDPLPIITETMDDPLPMIAETTDDAIFLITETIDDPINLITETMDDSMPLITETMDDPVPLITETMDDSVFVITETIDDPMPLITETTDDSIFVITETIDDPMPIMTEPLDPVWMPKTPEPFDDPQTFKTEPMSPDWMCVPVKPLVNRRLWNILPKKEDVSDEDDPLRIITKILGKAQLEEYLRPVEQPIDEADPEDFENNCKMWDRGVDDLTSCELHIVMHIVVQHNMPATVRNGKVEFSVTKFSHQVVSLIKEGLHLTRRSYQALVPQVMTPDDQKILTDRLQAQLGEITAKLSSNRTAVKRSNTTTSTASTACKSLEPEEPFGPAAMAKMARLSDEEEKVEVQEVTEKQRKKKRHKHHKKSKKHRLNERNEEQPE
ncbi:uncharacterized protein [Drosophila pseudoobscura]|uniref:Bromo domain-containing protein n=1 Tax=Drosophila pseudoobscura pseudoobscura TaxID=46245 RepID=A0A6I8UYF8_DROPS|nr:uncharacterized protein LOC6903138 [Drosophila pseudoobscura]XP_015036312.2 uncharacterized protein LOC6903138 [Drosophila pseudoobscura]